MLFLNGYKDEELFSLVDVYGRDKFYYKNSTNRIIMWDTEVSSFFATTKGIVLRLKHAILRYIDSFVDEPFESSVDDPLYSLRKKNYESKEAVRKRALIYALNKYKNTVTSFKPKSVPLSQAKNVSADDYLPEEFVFVKDAYDENKSTMCYWYPVDVDTILVDHSNLDGRKAGALCSLVDIANVKCGLVGFDQHFYHFDMSLGECLDNESVRVHTEYKMYALDDGVQRLALPKWVEKIEPFRNPIFFRDFILLPDNTCVNYKGELLEDKTRHYKNVKFINQLISDFSDCDDRPLPMPMELEFNIKRLLTKVTLNFTENIIVPHVYSTGFLDVESLKRFRVLKSIIEEAELTDCFEIVYKNIADINNFLIYGGKPKHMCSESILNVLKQLQSSMTKEEFAELVKDELELKKSVAKEKGIEIIKHEVSEEMFRKIYASSGEEVEVNDDPFWKGKTPGVLIELVSGDLTCLMICDETENGIIVLVV